MNPMKLIIVTGLSGSGKTVALRTLEDAGYYCIDNLPVALLKPLTKELLDHTVEYPGNVAVGIDARTVTDNLSALPEMAKALTEDGVDCRILFLETSDPVLLQRFSETRRRHPLTDDEQGLVKAIKEERNILKPLRDAATHLVDTSKRNVHELRHQIRTHVTDDPNRMQVLLKSFGFKYGIPEDADMVFDARCLPNPHWEAELRHLNGKDDAVQRFLTGEDRTDELIRQIESLTRTWLPLYGENGRNYFTISVGCTGGQHRSVYVIEQLARRLKNTISASLLVTHRELE